MFTQKVLPFVIPSILFWTEAIDLSGVLSCDVVTVLGTIKCQHVALMKSYY